jgi:hypothetical protein
MELLLKPEILTYIYGPTFGNAESHLFLFAAHRSGAKTEEFIVCLKLPETTFLQVAGNVLPIHHSDCTLHSFHLFE